MCRRCVQFSLSAKRQKSLTQWWTKGFLTPFEFHTNISNVATRLQSFPCFRCGRTGHVRTSESRASMKASPDVCILEKTTTNCTEFTECKVFRPDFGLISQVISIAAASPASPPSNRKKKKEKKKLLRQVFFFYEEDSESLSHFILSSEF